MQNNLLMPPSHQKQLDWRVYQAIKYFYFQQNDLIHLFEATFEVKPKIGWSVLLKPTKFSISLKYCQF